MNGMYHVLLPDGTKQTVTYYVDKDSGYVAHVTSEKDVNYKPPTQPQTLYETPVIENLYEPPVIENVYEPPVIENVYEPPVIDDVYEPPVADVEGPVLDLRTVF